MRTVNGRVGPTYPEMLAGVRLVLKSIEHVSDADLPPDLLAWRQAERGDPEPMPAEEKARIVNRLKLMEALAKYGQHLDGCVIPAGDPAVVECSCGWLRTRRELLRPAQYEAVP